jgi:hypothetical protein
VQRSEWNRTTCFTRRGLKNWEQGIRYPLPAGLAAIAKGLGISPGPLLEGVAFSEKETGKKPTRKPSGQKGGKRKGKGE